MWRSPQGQLNVIMNEHWRVLGQRWLIGGLFLPLMAMMGGCENKPVGTQTSPSEGPHSQTPTGLITNAGVTILDSAPLPALATGQIVYVPIYSEIYNQTPQTVSQLTATLSIRNTDPKHPLIIDSINYYDSSGQKIKAYLNQPIQLAPLASTAAVVSQLDQTGGVGANFIVSWGATEPLNPPVIEAVMISTASQQGLSFVSVGRVIGDR